VSEREREIKRDRAGLRERIRGMERERGREFTLAFLKC